LAKSLAMRSIFACCASKPVAEVFNALNILSFSSLL
jgi:hypothetical protein